MSLIRFCPKCGMLLKSEEKTDGVYLVCRYCGYSELLERKTNRIATNKKPRFDFIWLDLIKILKEREAVYTLSQQKVENKITKISSNFIEVVSEDTGKPRRIEKDDIEYAWNMLFEKETLEIDDVEPHLRYRKSIVIALLEQLPYISKVPGRKVKIMLEREELLKHLQKAKGKNR